MWTIELEDSLDFGIIYLAYTSKTECAKTRRPVAFKRTGSNALYLLRRNSTSLVWFPPAGFVDERGYVKLENEP